MKTDNRAHQGEVDGLGPPRLPLLSIRRDLRFAFGVALLVTGLGLFFVASAPAKQVRPFLGQFGGAGGPVFSRLGGLAVDQATGDLFAYDSGSEAVLKFDSTGQPAEFSGLGSNEITAVGGSGQGENEIAVDNSSGETAGDIYVANNSALLIYGPDGSLRGELTGEEPCGVAVDSAGNVYVGRYFQTVDKYTPTPGQNAPTDGDLDGTLTAPIGLCNVGVQSDGSNVYAAQYSGGLFKYPASQFGEPEAAGIDLAAGAKTLAVDPGSDHVLADTGSEVIEFDGSGDQVLSFGSGEISESAGVAVKASSDDVYVADDEAVEVFGPPVSLPDATTGEATAVTAAGATLNGSLNPSGVALSECIFEYGATEAYGEIAACEDPDAGEAGEGEGPVAVHADVTGLPANTEIHFRLRAGNVHGAGRGQDQNFTTAGPPVISEASVDTIEDTSARLIGRVNPRNQEVQYHFEYISDARYREDGEEYGAGAITIPVPDAIIGSGNETIFVAQQIDGLSAATTYHFRLVANGALFGPAISPDATFTTRLLPLSPEGRAYELVSPADKPGGQGIGSYSSQYPDGDADPGIASTDGNRYLSSSFAGNLTPGSFLYGNDYAMSERVSNQVGWVSHSPFTHHEYAAAGGANGFMTVKTASDDLSVLSWRLPVAPGCSSRRWPIGIRRPDLATSRTGRANGSLPPRRN